MTTFILWFSAPYYCQSENTETYHLYWAEVYKKAKASFNKRDLDNAIHLALKSDSIYKKHNNKPYSLANSLLALCYKDQGNWIKAHRHYEIAINEETKPNAKVILALNMAELGIEAGDTLIAIHLFIENIATVRNQFSDFDKAYCYHGFANLLRQSNYNNPTVPVTQLYDSAFYLFRKNLQYEAAGFTALNYSYYYASINKQDSISYWVHKAYEMQLKSNKPLGMADALLGLAKFHMEYQRVDSGLFYYKKALPFALKSNYLPFIEDSYKGLASAYEQQAQYDLSSKYLKQYYAIEDSLQKNKWRTELSKMQIEYDVKNKNKKISELAKSLNFFKYKYLSISIGLILCLAIITGIYLKLNHKTVKSSISKNSRKAVKPKIKQLSSEKLKIWDALEKLIKQDKIYLNQDLTLNLLATKLDTNRSTLSEIINEKSGKTFNLFINQYRIEEASRLLKDPKSDYLTIEGIAQETGFKSRSSFYTAFVNEKGITPSNFRKQVNTGVLIE
ncbi:helix-turn-helix domain-containing protein [Plebeiibacterium sediminum]|uniref:Helix-turn-helix domain-containing protein n=1 Tax=Plebeiibacterium sediminum TaxID=2992112 RepID=A0AAE3M5H3_9BACT|nr:helix-turn-helix domain-containing protein [Plebeiobacterium sediminum]MCW3787209.1 helix-turn-helix domain-containing protein [Plebeiobacterium sediminum]